MERVKSSDVLDVTHEVTTAFDAELLGSFRRAGPNAWDDYEFVRVPAKAKNLEANTSVSTPEEYRVVHALTPVQLENRGVDLRLRSEGRVVRVRFRPSAAAIAELETAAGEPFDPRSHGALLRRFFEKNYVRVQGQIEGRGAGAVIAEKLTSK
jgi:hypothetical protein